MLGNFWEWTTHDAVAFYTSVLAIFTGVLGISTIGLWIQTGRAARAAVQAAQHIPRVERAYVFVGPTKIIPHPDGIKVWTSLKLDNVGKTPAIVTKMWARFSHEPPLGAVPHYEDGVYFDVGWVLGANDRGIIPPVEWETPFADPQYFWGYVEYRDIFRALHTSRFCSQIIPNKDIEGKFRDAGEPAWNDDD